jgi:hypothetical protein
MRPVKPPTDPVRLSERVVRLYRAQSEIAENRSCPNWDKLLVKLGQVGSQTDFLDPGQAPRRHAQWLADVPVSRHAARF